MVQRDWTRLAQAWDWLNAYRANKELDKQFSVEVFNDRESEVLPKEVIDAWEEFVIN